MARYKQYENGIFGRKYKGLYIVKDSPEKRKSTFSVYQEDKTPLYNSLEDYHEAEWAIDLKTASESEIALIKELEKQEIFELNGEVAKYAEIAEIEKLTKEQKVNAMWVEKVRNRKSEGKEIWICF